MGSAPSSRAWLLLAGHLRICGFTLFLFSQWAHCAGLSAIQRNPRWLVRLVSLLWFYHRLMKDGGWNCERLYLSGWAFVK